MMLFVLILVLAVLLLIVLNVGHLEVFSPSAVFLFGFLACACMAFCFQDVWMFDIKLNTFCTIIGGVTLFAVFDLFVMAAVRKNRVNSPSNSNWKLPVNQVVIFAVLLLQIASFVWMISVIQHNYPASSVPESIRLFNDAKKFSGTVVEPFPRPLSITRNICTAFTYLFIYCLAQNLSFREKKGTILLATSFIVACIASFSSGGRMTALSYLFYLLVQYYFLRCRLTGKKSIITLKNASYTIIGIIVLLLTFQASLPILGRSSSIPLLEYLAIYVGAQIPNFDIFMQTDFPRDKSVWGNMTFITTIQWFGQKLGISDWVYPLDLPFQSMNGHNLGNVYTSFYAPLYDYGYWGLLTLIPVMAVVSRLIYEKAINSSANCAACIWLILYAFVSFALLMSFFSNVFYESVFCIGMIRTVCYLIVCYFVYTRIIFGTNTKKQGMLITPSKPALKLINNL